MFYTRRRTGFKGSRSTRRQQDKNNIRIRFECILSFLCSCTFGARILLTSSRVRPFLRPFTTDKRDGRTMVWAQDAHMFICCSVNMKAHAAGA